MSVSTFNPFRFPGKAMPLRVLTKCERDLLGAPCPFCKTGQLRVRKTRFSEYVSCTEAPKCNKYITPETARQITVLGDHNYLSTAAGEAAMRSLVLRMAEAPTIPSVATTFADVSAKAFDPADIEAAKAEFPTKKRGSERVMEEMARLEEIAKSPTFAERMKAAKEAKRAAREAQAPKTITYDILYPRIKKLADGVQAAYKQQRVSGGFALRREVMCAKLWRAGRAASLGPEEALQLAFALTASERATDDERDFYDNLWRAEFGSNLYPLPFVDAKHVLGADPALLPGEVLHQQAGVALMVTQANIPLWVLSEAGEGKTVLTKQMSRLFALNYTRLQGTQDRTVDEIIGGFGFADGKTEWRDGVISGAARTPTLLHLDEVSALPTEVQFETHALLEGEFIMQAKNGGITIVPHARFRIVGNDNSVGQGEAVNYVGTRSTNLAFRDRWAFLKLGSLPDALRRQIVLTASE